MSNSEEKYFDERLGCCLESLTYDFNTHSGKLYISGYGCCDMSGCIDFFESIDPHVSQIFPYSKQNDVFYKKIESEWKSYIPKNHLEGKNK